MIGERGEKIESTAQTPKNLRENLISGSRVAHYLLAAKKMEDWIQGPEDRNSEESSTHH
jgi:hypothetical protein